MSPGYAKVLVVAANVVMIAIRAPHGQRSRTQPVRSSHRGVLETTLLGLAAFAFFVPLAWIVSPVLAFADYPLHPVPFAVGFLGLAYGLWLFHRAHADLGTNWSITLEIRERHTLVTRGVYARVRHPMYSALLLVSLGQALALPNWIAGPSYLVSFGLLVALRLGPEERMMLAEFGSEYEAYRARTKRLVRGLW